MFIEESLGNTKEYETGNHAYFLTLVRIIIKIVFYFLLYFINVGIYLNMSIITKFKLYPLYTSFKLTHLLNITCHISYITKYSAKI